jgi:signal transduction histidine kinase
MEPTTLRRAAWLTAMPLALVALLAGWVYLYMHSHAVDTSEQNATLGLLKDMKQLDSDWSASVLRSHTDLDLNYDALAAPLRPFADDLARLRGRVAPLGDPALDDALGAIGAALGAKSSLIDEFKAQNSLYKNSLRYVPTAHRDIQARMRGERDAGLAAESTARRETSSAFDRLASSLAAAKGDGADAAAGRARVDQALEEMRRRVKSSTATDGAVRGAADMMNLDGNVGALVDEALRYSSAPDRELAESLRADIDRLRAAVPGYPPQVREPVLNLLAHVETLLRLRSKQTELLRRIAQVPVAGRIEGFAALLTQRFNAELATQFRYQRLLLVYSAFALLLVIGATGFILYRNATEQRRLRTLVDEQTRALKENEVHLVHAQRMAAVGELVASVAHEVNTPLAAVKSSLQSSRELLEGVGEHYVESGRFLDLVKGPRPTDAAGLAAHREATSRQFRAVREQRREIDEFDSLRTVDELMGDSIRCVDHISEVVLNMLNFSRLDSTRVVAGRIEEGIESTLAIARHLLRGVRLVREFGDTQPVACDLAQINQVVLNLVKNAVQALPDGQGEIRIATAMHDAREVRIEVTDNGSGIPPEILPRIWNPFFTTKGAAGTGLGLSTCRKIVEAHGGRIGVESQAGRGTTFWITLPMKPPASLYESHGQDAESRLFAAA